MAKELIVLTGIERIISDSIDRNVRGNKHD